MTAKNVSVRMAKVYAQQESTGVLHVITQLSSRDSVVQTVRVSPVSLLLLTGGVMGWRGRSGI
jgi:hypothetical protein